MVLHRNEQNDLSTSMYFHIKLVIYLEYTKFLRMLLPNYKKINVECVIEAAKSQLNHKNIDNFLCACVYMWGKGED